MRFLTSKGILTILALTAILTSPALLAQTPSWDNDKVVSEATSGFLKNPKGEYFEQACGESVDYDTEVVDLNGDGQPEVFTNMHGICMGGATGVHMNLYIKNKMGKWIPQFGFPGIYTVLKTKKKGYPDIEIGGSGNCFPVWRWNGKQYMLDRFEYEGKRCNK
jgi:hypothetical protein